MPSNRRKRYQKDLPVANDEQLHLNDSKQKELLPEVDTIPDVPAEDYYPVMRFDELVEVWKDWIVGITSLDASLVQFAHQYNPKEFPKVNTNWISFTINSSSPTNYPSVVHNDKEHGYDVLTDYINEEIIIYCIGPNSYDMANYLRRAIMIDQNRYMLRRNNIGITTVSNAFRSPILQNEAWIQQTNIVISYVREVKARYNVRNLIQVDTTDKGESGADQEFAEVHTSSAIDPEVY